MIRDLGWIEERRFEELKEKLSGHGDGSI
jgi:hypothetical protein